MIHRGIKMYFSIENFELRRNTITEVCILPTTQIHKIMLKTSTQFKKSVFIDTIGNLKCIVDSFYVVGYRSFVRILRSLREDHDFALFIDSIVIIDDLKKGFYNRVYDLLSELVYRNNVTIIVSNHYRFIYTDKMSYFVPRLGDKWTSLLSYRIMYKYKNNKPMDGEFCSECNNLLYPKEDNTDSNLILVCKTCDHIQEPNTNRISATYFKSRFTSFQTYARDLVNDPTLPKMKILCGKCGNTTAVYFQSKDNNEDVAFDLVYICTRCYNYWT